MKKLSKLLASGAFPRVSEAKAEKEIKSLVLKMVRIQQGIWHRQDRVMIVFEGFDASGKGGTIRRLVEKLDPRGFHVYPIGPPDPGEQAKHYLYRFWTKLPAPGTISIFDRSWYGRVLVEKVEKLAPRDRIKQAYDEINEFEALLRDDGVQIIKIFLGITKDEQYRRFEARLKDPFKQWKFTEEDLKARAKWDDYVKAVDRIFKKTDTKKAPWTLISANDKDYARLESLKTVTHELQHHHDWMLQEAERYKVKSLEADLRKLEKVKNEN